MTWSRIQSKLARYGITRMANVTGLDRIGIPVWMAVRPNSRSLAVAQGKGADAISAKVSAAAESIECWHAEHPPCRAVVERYDDLRLDAAVAEPESLPSARQSLFSRKRRIPWVEAIDATSGDPVWVPFELVHADSTVPRAPGSGCFVFSTNGLASGNTPVEALLHGVCELIERDAIALWKQKSDAAQTATRLDLTTVDDGQCRALLDRYDHAGIVPMVWNVTSDTDVAVFRALIYDRWASEMTPYPTAFGAGCHPDRALALSRALTEAAQSRLTAIAGSRDDGPRARYDATQSAEARDYYGTLAAQPGTVDFLTVPTFLADTVEEDLRHVADRLRRSGFRRVLAVDLTRLDSPLCVIRSLVPGLEGPSSSPSYVPGPRASAVQL